MPGEIEFILRQNLFHERRALIDPLEITVEDHARRTRVTRASRCVREMRQESEELGNVALEEKLVRAIERIEVAVLKLRGHWVVKVTVGELRLFQKLRGELRDLTVRSGCIEPRT
jgi:hypothetical protein